MVTKFLFLSFFFFSSVTFYSNATTFSHRTKSDLSLENSVEMVYSGLKTNHYELPKLESFTQALKGFYKLKEKGLIHKDILTLIDFSLSSNMKRLWVIDLASKTILYQSLVAHGRNTGKNLPIVFRMQPNPLKAVWDFMLRAKCIMGNTDYHCDWTD